MTGTDDFIGAKERQLGRTEIQCRAVQRSIERVTVLEMKTAFEAEIEWQAQVQTAGYSTKKLFFRCEGAQEQDLDFHKSFIIHPRDISYVGTCSAR